MRYVVLLVLFFGFTTPVHAGWMSLPEGEGGADGKGIACTDKTEGAIKPGTLYFRFESGHVFTLRVSREVPLKIDRSLPVKYRASVDHIKWGKSNVLSRKTLELTSASGNSYDCQVMSPLEIEAALDKKIEELEEEMKDNKI